MALAPALLINRLLPSPATSTTELGVTVELLSDLIVVPLSRYKSPAPGVPPPAPAMAVKVFCATELPRCRSPEVVIATLLPYTLIAPPKLLAVLVKVTSLATEGPIVVVPATDNAADCVIAPRISMFMLRDSVVLPKFRACALNSFRSRAVTENAPSKKPPERSIITSWVTAS